MTNLYLFLKRFSTLVLSACFLVGGVSLSPAAQAATVPTPYHWQAEAGYGAANGKIAAMKFYPAVITIDEGDSITWTMAGDAHTVSFLSGATPPIPGSPESLMPIGGATYDGTGIVSSGLIEPKGMESSGGSYTLTFTKAGTYTYNCLIHPGMQGTVVVQPAGSSYPKTQTQYRMDNHDLQFADLKAGYVLLRHEPAVVPFANADSTTTYQVDAGLGKNYISIMRFMPETLFIHKNDSIMWINEDDMNPHTITFPGPDKKLPEAIDPASQLPIGSTSFDGSQLTSSGFIYPMAAPGNHTYTLNFPKPGRYTYYCLLHDEMGMIGNVIVSP